MAFCLRFFVFNFLDRPSFKREFSGDLTALKRLGLCVFHQLVQVLNREYLSTCCEEEFFPGFLHRALALSRA